VLARYFSLFLLHTYNCFLHQFTIHSLCISGSGGAIYLECSDLDEFCAAVMNRSIGLPTSPFSFKALELINNLAYAYGNNIATSPYETVSLGDTSLSLIPMITPMNVHMLMKDRFGQIVKGTAEIQIPYILESWTCSSVLCRIQHSLSPLTFLSFDPESGIADTSAFKKIIPCGRSSSTVTVHFALYGSTSRLLIETFTVFCLECGASQVRVNEVESAIWFCRPCLSGQYVIQDTCNDCPTGKHK
jgi:hypothetical protein